MSRRAVSATRAGGVASYGPDTSSEIAFIINDKGSGPSHTMLWKQLTLQRDPSRR